MSQLPTWALVLFAADGFLLLVAFWIWTTRKNNKNRKP